jgi:vesicle-fusing ATPase
MVEWNEVGPRFSHSIQQALSTLLRASPPNGNRLLILVTTSSRSTLARLGMLPAFKRQISVPTVKTMNELWNVLEGKQAFESSDGENEVDSRNARQQAARAERQKAIQNVMQKSGDTIRVGIKTILETVDSATYGGSGFGMAQEFAEILDAHVQEANSAVNGGGQQMYVE